MKKNIAAVIVFLAAFSQSAFAGGVEKHYILPADAHNVKIASVEVGSDIDSQTLISDGNDGPVYENNYGPRLDVEVTYDSADHTDDKTELSNDNDPQEVVVGGPSVIIQLPLSQDEANAIQSGRLDAASLVNLTVFKKDFSVADEKYADFCHFDDNGVYNPFGDNSACIVKTYHTENRPVASVARK
jgi:hypothetical protein